MMDLRQLVGRYARLQRELSVAYSMVPWHSGLIDRLANDLASTERQIAALQKGGEHCNDTMLIVNQRAAAQSEITLSVYADGERRHFEAARAVINAAAASSRDSAPRV